MTDDNHGLTFAERMRLYAWLEETYDDDGVWEWWRHYFRGDDEQRRRMIAESRCTSEGNDGW